MIIQSHIVLYFIACHDFCPVPGKTRCNLIRATDHIIVASTLVAFIQLVEEADLTDRTGSSLMTLGHRSVETYKIIAPRKRNIQARTLIFRLAIVLVTQAVFS